MAITYETLKSFCSEYDIHTELQYATKRKDGWWASDGRRIICVPMDQTQKGDIRFLCEELPKELKYPPVEDIIDVKGFIPEFTFNISAINEALEKLPKVDEYREVERDIKFIKCPECDDGEIEISDSICYKGKGYDLYATCVCPICHGYGKIPDIDDYDPDEDDYDPDDEEYTTKEKTGRKIPDTKGTLIHFKDVAYIKACFMDSLLRVAREQNTDQIECSGGNYNRCVIFRINSVIVGLMPVLRDYHEQVQSVDVIISK